MLTYNETHFFAAFRALDPDPSQIRARFSDRDRAFSDDFVGVVVDTFNDERRAFEFFVNPLGVQMDLLKDDVGGSEDSSWDAIWSSAGRVTESGSTLRRSRPSPTHPSLTETRAPTTGVPSVKVATISIVCNE